MGRASYHLRAMLEVRSRPPFDCSRRIARPVPYPALPRTTAALSVGQATRR